MLADRPPEQQAIERALLALAVEAMPEGIVQVDFRTNGALTVGVTAKQRDMVFAIIAHREYVNLQLTNGADLPDPTGIVEGTGQKIGHVKIRSLDDIERLPIRDLVHAQAAMRS